MLDKWTGVWVSTLRPWHIKMQIQFWQENKWNCAGATSPLWQAKGLQPVAQVWSQVRNINQNVNEGDQHFTTLTIINQSDEIDFVFNFMIYRYMRTCQECPEIYPWTGRTGIANSLVDSLWNNTTTFVWFVNLFHFEEIKVPSSQPRKYCHCIHSIAVTGTFSAIAMIAMTAMIAIP